MEADGPGRGEPSVWERLDAQKAGVGSAPYDTLELGDDPMLTKPSEEEERAKWAADLAAVAEQRKAQPSPRVQTTSSINPHDWDLPSGAARAEVQAKAIRAAAPQEVKQKWADDLAARGARQYPRKFADVHLPSQSQTSGHGAVLSCDGAIKGKPALQRSRAAVQIAKQDQVKTKTKTEVVQSLAAQQRGKLAETTGTGGERISPRKMSRVRLDALAVPKSVSSSRGDSYGASSLASARFAPASTQGVGRSSRHHTGAGPTNAPDLQQKQAWRATAREVRESIRPETWAAMDRAQKKDFLREAMTQRQQLPYGGRADAFPADDEVDAQLSVSISESVVSDTSAVSARSSRRSVPSLASIGTAGADRACVAKTSRTVKAHTVSNWNASEQFTGTADGHQEDHFVTSARASYQGLGASQQQLLPQSIQSLGTGRGGGVDEREGEVNGRRQAAVARASLYTSSFSLG